METLKQHVESIIFSSENPTTVKDIQECLTNTYGWEMNAQDIESCIDELVERYADEIYSFELVQISGGYHFMTKKDYYGVVSAYLNIKSKKKLSTSALETLAIIAYKQPI